MSSPSSPSTKLPSMAGHLVLTAATLCSCQFCFLPLRIYSGNLAEYSTSPPVVLRALLLFTAAATLALVAIGWIIRPRGRPVYCAALLGLTIAAYIQANFMAWDYGILDGHEFQWARHAGKAGPEILLWAACLILTLACRRATLRHARLLCFSVLLIQTATTAVEWFKHPTPPWSQSLAIDESGMLAFSSRHNLVVVTLDAMQSNVFADVIAEDASLREAFAGFTYFPNVVSGFSATYGSIPNMLTGEFYTNNEPIGDYLRRSYRSSVFRDMKAADYRVEFYPWSTRVMHLEPAIASNLRPKFPSGLLTPEIIQLMDVSLFRHVPHPVKKRVVGSGSDWFFARSLNSLVSTADEDVQSPGLSTGTGPRDLRFHRLLSTVRLASDDAPRFKYIHLQGAHRPFWIDEKLQFRMLRQDTSGYLTQARASLKIVADFLEKLHRVGADRTTDILIVSDHGAGMSGPSLPATVGTDADVPASVQRSGLALVLLRRAGATAYAINRAPVALSDVAVTLADLAGLGTSGRPGISLLHPSTDAGRPRDHYYYVMESWDQEYLPVLEHYRVSGDSWNPASWHATGEFLAPGEPPAHVTAARSGHSAAGKILSEWTPAHPESARFGSGWDPVRKDGAPLRPGRARVRLQVPKPTAAPLLFEFTMRVTEGAAWRPLSLRFGGDRVQTLLLQPVQTATARVLVDGGLVRNGHLDIEFELGSVPGTLPSSGCIIQGFSLQEIPSRSSGQFLKFTTSGNARPYQLFGWSRSEKTFTWTDGRRTSLLLPVTDRASDLDVTVALSPYLAAGDLSAQHVLVGINGHAVAKWTVRGTAEWTVRVPRTLLTGDWFTLDFELPGAGRPSDRKTRPTTDLRTLGIRVSTVRVTSASMSEKRP